MIEKVGKSCCGCSACAEICPKHCIHMEDKGEGFLYPVVAENACVQCQLCEKVCPVLAKEPVKDDFLQAWGVINQNSEILADSSSGGLFTALSEAIIGAGGCVFGAAFSEDFQKVSHIMVESMEELKKLRGSKYIQSEMNDCYSAVQEQLRKQRLVLFTGTPCQIAGLKSYLMRDYDSLFLVDIICHGAPSAAVWRRYLQSVQEKAGGKIKAVRFRHKKNGWKSYGMEVSSEGGHSYYCVFRDDPYMRLFLKNYILRESCYQCKVKEQGSKADITMGDFWGVEHAAPQLDHPMGVTLAVVHTEKGLRLFEKVKQKLIAEETDYSKALVGNPCYRFSVKRPKERENIFCNLEKYSWDKIVKRYSDDNIQVILKRKLSSSFLGKLRKALINHHARKA